MYFLQQIKVICQNQNYWISSGENKNKTFQYQNRKNLYLEVYYYKIETELGNLFIIQTEIILSKIEFGKAICSEKSVAYFTQFFVWYEFNKKDKKNKK